MKKKRNYDILLEISTSVGTLTERIDNIKTDTQELKVEVKKINGIKTEVATNKERSKTNRRLFWWLLTGVITTLVSISWV